MTESSKCPLAARNSCFRASFAVFPTLSSQIVFSLDSARSYNSMSVGTCAEVDIGLKICYPVTLPDNIQNGIWLLSGRVTEKICSIFYNLDSHYSDFYSV